MKNQPVLTVGGVARQLGCTPQTVRNLAERSGIQPTRDTANRRLALHNGAYIRLQEHGWSAAAYPELWIEQTKDGVFRAVEPKSGNILRYPSRRRYEVSFLTHDIFDCAIECLKEKQSKPLYELVVVTFGNREGFIVDAGNLLAPDDYASVRELEPGRQWFPTPPLFT